MRIPYCNVCGQRVIGRYFSLVRENPDGTLWNVIDLCEKCLVEHCDYEILREIKSELSTEYHFKAKRKKDER